MTTTTGARSATTSFASAGPPAVEVRGVSIGYDDGLVVDDLDHPIGRDLVGWPTRRGERTP